MESGKPYPSAGFNAAFITAHEMGHNLGMSHDSQGNACARNGFIMSPSRGIRGETTWSACSRRAILDMAPNCLDDKPQKRPVKNHRIFRELPGQTFDAYEQCQIFLRDPDAELYSPDSLQDVCNRVKCKSPNRIGYYYAGPALEGTFCGDRKYCISGSCRSWSSDPPPKVVQGGWGQWNVSECSSGCLDKALGVSLSVRRCDSPKPQNTATRCPGPARSLQFCDDTAQCNFRMTAKEYASQKCREFSQLVPALQAGGDGTQASHSESAEWKACAIYCRDNSRMWYTPREELSDLGVDTFFPDGTWCHKDPRTGVNYYCQHHRCRPKVSRGAKMLFDDSEDLAASTPLPVLRNALSGAAPDSEALVEMHRLTEDKQQVTTSKPLNSHSAEKLEEFEMDEDIPKMPGAAKRARGIYMYR